nr:VWA domain-containing protein [Methylococcus sp. BF19-07]
MERTDSGLRVRLDKRAFLDRDFILTLASNKVQSSCIVIPDGDGHVALASLRIPQIPELERQPLALKLVIDCSGSMAGTSIAQARKAALAILDQLRSGDSFNITLFGSDYKHFFRTMVPASAHYITEAWNLIDGMDADMGGTEMEEALNGVFALKGDDATGIPNEQPTAQFAIDTPAGFVAALELELVGLVRQPKLPNRIDELAKCGLPEVIVANLRQLVAKGRDEAEVVAAFVYALSQSGIGDSFGRAFKRAILKDWKQVVPGREIDRVMSYALQEVARDNWNWQAEPFDQLAANLAETT